MPKNAINRLELATNGTVFGSWAGGAAAGGVADAVEGGSNTPSSDRASVKDHFCDLIKTTIARIIKTSKNKFATIITVYVNIDGAGACCG